MENLTTKEIFSLAVQNHKKNNIKAAQNLYNQILKVNPSHVDANNNLGVIFQQLEQSK